MSDLKIKGKLIKVLKPVSGTSKAGKEWNKQDFVINTGGDYPDDICFTLFGDKSNAINAFNVGDKIEVDFNVSSREFNEKWYHNLNAWKVELIQQTHSAADYPPTYNEEDKTKENGDEEDLLPF